MRQLPLLREARRPFPGKTRLLVPVFDSEAPGEASAAAPFFGEMPPCLQTAPAGGRSALAPHPLLRTISRQSSQRERTSSPCIRASSAWAATSPVLC